ncbi:TonB-dependent receptor [Fibrella aquatilis]|uniref:TonB-dependent receptor n=1 Tax=Fibrella aquatilis TaxID=2817059 RepID=A0A939JUH4_9BACT|nr:TonB-dependent receptor [Fibrella aquatilis]MBO0929782.1 TonB-dependent receptor [Fibrella aquatilis]
MQHWLRNAAAAFLALLFLTITALAQTGNISGTVTDAKGEAVAGASAVIKGSTKGATSNANGQFTIDNLANGDYTVVVSSIGFTARELKASVPGGGVLRVQLTETAANLDEVVVTGLFDQRTRLEASVAISTLNTQQIERVAATSAADLLKNIPGVYVNQARGEIWNTVYSRGISAGSIDNASGYYYVSLQEDGLPVTNLNSGVDSYLRVDASTARVEAVRGGTASILGANAPGGIFNYVSKTGGKTLQGEVRAKYGLEGDGKNPYYRADVNVGGPLNAAKDLTFNVGGFYRTSNGARYPGYAMNNGGQLRANILKTYATGSLKVYAKFLDDRNAVSEFIPTQGWDNPQIPAGFSTTDSYYLPDVTLQLPINGSGAETFQSKDKFHATELTAGLSWVQDLGRGFTLKNDGRLSSKNFTQSVPAVVTPFAVDGLLFYAIPHNLGKFGTYTFTDRVTGQTLGTVTQLPNIINGNFAGFKFIPGEKNSFPGANVQNNSLFFLPLFFSKNDRSEFTDQFSVTKKLDKMSFTAGAFLSSSHIDIVGSGQDFGIGVGTLQDRPHLTDIKLTGLDGKVYQVTDPNGFMDVGRDGTNLASHTQNQLALFLGHDWLITPALNLDWGIRYERVGFKGFNAQAVPNPKRNDPTNGGRDGNPLTLYDNGGGTEGPHLDYDQRLSTLSFSGGLNYRFSDKQAVYVRYSNGNKSPDVNFFTGLTTPYTLANTPVTAQNVEQVEAAYKVSTQRLKLFVTPFYSVLSNVPNNQTFTNANGSNYNPGTQFAKYTTTGVELEASYNVTRQFAVRAGATVQGSTATSYKAYLENGPGPQDDVLLDYSGNETDNNARLIFNINPTYSGTRFFASLNYTYLGARQANVPNAFQLPAFGTADLSAGYTVTPKLTLQANINNLFNTYGILGWSGPGGFPAALNRQGFTKAYVAANPNAIYATQGSMPRAYFLTASYKF